VIYRSRAALALRLLYFLGITDLNLSRFYKKLPITCKTDSNLFILTDYVKIQYIITTLVCKY